MQLAYWLFKKRKFYFIAIFLLGFICLTGEVNANQSKLFQAVSQNDMEVVRNLIDQGVDIEQRDSLGRTALLIATHQNAIEIANMLINAGADVNAMDNINDSPYLYAGAEGRLEILRFTLSNGANLTSVNRYGGTALIPAAHHGHVDVVKELLSTDIEIDYINNLGWTALLEAIILGDGSATYIKIVQLLIDAGADVNISDGDGVSPLTHTIRRGFSNIEKLLRNEDAKESVQ